MRELYDKQLEIKSANAEGFYSDIQETKREWREESRQEFKSAYAIAVGESYPPTRAFNLSFIAVAGFELGHEEIFSILSLVTRVRTEPSFVRIAALAVLAWYVDQLMVSDIGILLLLSSSRNRIDDRHLTEGKISIKQMARDIADQWLKIQFDEYLDRLDQVIEVVVNTDNKYPNERYKWFRKFFLQALEDNQYLEKLTPEHIRLLQRFSRRDIRYFFTIRNIVNQWNRQADNTCPNLIKKLGS